MKRAIIPLAAAIILAATPTNNEAHTGNSHMDAFQYNYPLADISPQTGKMRTDIKNEVKEAAINALAIAIYSEGSICPRIEKIAIAHTVINRLNSPRYGSSLEDVLDPRMYNGMAARNYLEKEVKNDPRAQKVYAECRNIAQEALYGESSDPTGGATLYYNPEKSNPNWNRSVIQEVKLPGKDIQHRFYIEK